MNAPPVYVLLFGNWLGFLAALATGSCLLLNWLLNPMTTPWLAPFMGALIIGQALRARWHYRQYKALKQAWEEAAGIAQKRAQTRATARRTLTVLGSAGLWWGCLWWLSSHHGHADAEQIAVLLWLLITGAWTCWGLWRVGQWARRRKQAIQTQRERDYVVSVALPAARVTPTVANIRAALPDYCLRLLERSEP